MIHLLLLVLASVAAPGPAEAQRAGSVLCEHALRRTDTDLKASARRVEAVRNASTADKCEAYRVHTEVLTRASQIFERCTSGRERDENVGQMIGSAADFRVMVREDCGG